MILTVVMIGRDDAGHLARSLGGVLASRPAGEVEVVFVDDASSDNTSEEAARLCRGAPDVKVVKTTERMGIGGARNFGMAYATGDYVYFHDSDDYMEYDGIGRIVEAIKKNGQPDVVLVPFRTLKAGGQYEDKSPQFVNSLQDAVNWAVGAWAAVVKRSLYVPQPEKMYAEDTSWHFLQYDRFESFAKVEGERPCYVWDCTNPSAVTRTVEYFWSHSLTLENLAFSNILINEGLKDEFVSDSLRNLAEMYDSRRQLTKPWVRDAWARRFQSCYQRVMSGHFGH